MDLKNNFIYTVNRGNLSPAICLKINNSYVCEWYGPNSGESFGRIGDSNPCSYTFVNFNTSSNEILSKGRFIAYLPTNTYIAEEAKPGFATTQRNRLFVKNSEKLKCVYVEGLGVDSNWGFSISDLNGDLKINCGFNRNISSNKRTLSFIYDNIYYSIYFLVGKASAKMYFFQFNSELYFATDDFSIGDAYYYSNSTLKQLDLEPFYFQPEVFTYKPNTETAYLVLNISKIFKQYYNKTVSLSDVLHYDNISPTYSFLFSADTQNTANVDVIIIKQ